VAVCVQGCEAAVEGSNVVGPGSCTSITSELSQAAFQYAYEGTSTLTAT
jgi:hypothetical protein